MRRAPLVLTLLLLPLVLHTPNIAAATPDFTVSAFYTYDSSTPVDTIILSGQNGYSGTINLTIFPSPGFYSSLDPYTAVYSRNSTLTPSTSSVNLFLFTSANTPGNYSVVLTAKDGTLTHTLTIRYNIVPGTVPNFSIDSSQGLSIGWHILRGSSDLSAITVRSSNGFAGTVVLQSASFPSGLALSFDHSTVKVQPGSPGMASMSLSAPATVPVGTYTVVLNGTSGAITQVIYLDVLVDFGFALKANPTTLTLAQGGQASSTIILSSIGGWTGTTGVSATCDPSLTCSLNPPSIQISDPTSTAQSILTVSVSSTTLPGQYTVNIAETNPTPTPSFTQRTSLTIVVTGPDFTVSANPAALTFAPGVAGTLHTTVTLTSLDAFSGFINTTVSISPSVGPPLPDPPSASPTSKNLTYVTPSGPSSFTITIFVDSMVMEGPYIVQISAMTKMPGGLLSHTFYADATVGPDFRMSATLSNLVVHQGTLAISTITFASLNGFAGGMMLEAAPLSVLPPNPRTDFFPSYPVVSRGGTNSTEFAVIADQYTGLGIYNVWISASTSVMVGFGWIGHAIPMTITVEGPVTGPDFALSSQPSKVDLSIGSTSTSTISLNSVNGFRGALTLQVESYLLGALSPSSVTISPTISASSTLTITAPTPYQIDGYPLWYPASGDRSLLVIASNSTGFSHWTWVNETVAPVSVVPNPDQLNLWPGSSGTSQIVVTSLSGFNLTVSMSASISPYGPTISLSNSLINFSASVAPASLALTVNVPQAVQGDFVVTINATSMSHMWFCQCGYYNITYSTPVYVHAVASAPPSGQGPGPNSSPPPSGSTSGILGLPPTEFYGIITAAILALIFSTGYLGLRRRKRPVGQ